MMSSDRPKHEAMTTEEEMTLNMLRLAALLEELEPKSCFTKQDQDNVEDVLARRI
jgi:hypothetical protein